MSDERHARVRAPGTNGRGAGDSVVPAGVWVDDSDEDDPVLRQADGTLVDTWREEYPYAERLSREEYDHVKRLLQVELLKLQYWVRDSGGRLVVRVWDTNVGDWPVTQPGHGGLSVMACSDARSGRACLDARLLPDLLPRAEITESA